MKNLFKVLSLAVVAAFVLASCQKEEAVSPIDDSIVAGDDILSIEKQIENPIGKKGFLMDYSALVQFNLLEIGIAMDENGNEYKTLKIPKTDGNYFYIMIENFKYDDSQDGSWAYERSSSYEATHGRLYQWEKARELGGRITMQFPSPFPIPGAPPVFVTGELPNAEHIKLLLNKVSIPHLYDYEGVEGYYGDIMNNALSLEEKLKATYFDIFTFGIAKTTLEGGHHSLGGKRDNIDIAPMNREFVSLNENGYFWTNDGDKNFYYPLSIAYKFNGSVISKYSAHINAMHSKKFAYSVRYVFDPFN